MASVRKQYTRSKPAHVAAPLSEAFEFASFMSDLLDGTVQATAVHEVRDGQGRLTRLEYDDPDGSPGAGQGGASTRGNNEPPESTR